MPGRAGRIPPDLIWGKIRNHEVAVTVVATIKLTRSERNGGTTLKSLRSATETHGLVGPGPRSLLRNPVLMASAVVGPGLMLGLLYTGPGQALLHTYPLDPTAWVATLLLTPIPFHGTEAVKAIEALSGRPTAHARAS
jgi:hypothetical protein